MILHDVKSKYQDYNTTYLSSCKLVIPTNYAIIMASPKSTSLWGHFDCKGEVRIIPCSIIHPRSSPGKIIPVASGVVEKCSLRIHDIRAMLIPSKFKENMYIIYNTFIIKLKVKIVVILFSFKWVSVFQKGSNATEFAHICRKFE